MSTPLACAPGSSAAARLRLVGAWLLVGCWCVLAAVLVGGQAEPEYAARIDDVGQLGFAATSAACSGAAALRTAGRTRSAWLALMLGTLGWALGQLAWTVQELVFGRPSPFPSVSDLGFLIFPLGATVAVALFAAGNARLRGRDVIDGLILALTLSAVTWSTGLAQTVRGGELTLGAQLLSVTYPISDVIMLTMALLAFARSGSGRTVLGLLAAGAGAMAFSDSAFSFLIGGGSYASGNADGLGWAAAFALFAVAGLRQGEAHRPDSRLTDVGPTQRTAGQAPGTGIAAGLVFVPYLPLIAAGTAAAVQWVSGAALEGGELALLLLATTLTMARQFVTLRDDRRLSAQIAVREADLDRRAERDALTGLTSRSRFIAHVGRALDEHRATGTPLTVILCDVDDFKGVNDGLGHAVGDRLLAVVASRLAEALDGEGVLARLGGDEFAVLLTGRAGAAAPAAGEPEPFGEGSGREVAGRLQAALATELQIEGSTVCVGLSVGLAHVRGDAETPSTDILLSRADTAMHTAKRGPSTGPVLYRHGLSLPEAGDWFLRPPLEQGLREGAVLPYYQPIVELEPGRLHGFEALARWRRGPEVVGPGIFLPVAQRAGLMPALTAHMLRQAAVQLVEWTARPGLGHLRVAVNVSPAQLVDPLLPDLVRGVLEDYDVPLGGLVIEITEEVLLTDLDAAVGAARTLRELGVLICLDDFGVGYSSLAHLHRLPLDKLKLDQSFVRNVDVDPSLRRLLGGLLALSRDLGLSVVAEGIEHAGQARALRDLGCPQGQGLLYSAAVPPADCEALLTRVESASGTRSRRPLRATA